MSDKPKRNDGGGRFKTLLLSGIAEVSGAGVAVLVALPSNSVALWSNAARISLEAALCVTALVGIRHSSRARDERFNYGLGKLESLTSLFGGIAMLGILLLVGWQAFNRFRDPQAVTGASWGIAFLLFSFGFNLVLFRRLRHHLEEEFSPIVQTQMLLYRNALVATGAACLAVIAGSLFPGVGWIQYLDPLGALVLCWFILKTGLSLIRGSINHLLDGAVEESVQVLITRELVRHFAAYEQLHGVRTRRSGARVYVEVFLSFDPAESHGAVLRRAEDLKVDLENSVAGAEVWIVPVRPPATG